MRLTPLLCAFFWTAHSADAQQISIPLPTGGEIKAEMALPNTTGKKSAGNLPAVIYLHSVIVREAGYGGAADRRYDIADFTRAFAHAGFAAIAPIRTTPVSDENEDDAAEEGLSTVLGELSFLRDRKDVNPNRISVVGFGEGGLMALWALSQMPDIAKGVVMSPMRMNNSSAFSMDRFVETKAALPIRAPVLITVGAKETRTSIRTATDVSQALMKAYRRFWFIQNYPGKQRWFHQPRDAFMRDVIAFLKR